jgi:hypothetical protein
VRLVRDAIVAADPEKAREQMADLEAGYEENLLKNYPRQMERTVVWSDLSDSEAG